MTTSDWGALAAWLVAAVFLLAGIAKLAQPAQWRSQSASLGVPWVVAMPVPLLELAIGALLAVQWQRRAVAWCAVVVLAAFTALLGLRLAQGRRPPCACFGSLRAKPIGMGSLVRNTVFLATALAAAVL